MKSGSNWPSPRKKLPSESPALLGFRPNKSHGILAKRAYRPPSRTGVKKKSKPPLEAYTEPCKASKMWPFAKIAKTC